MEDSNVRKPFKQRGRDLLDENGQLVATLSESIDDFTEKTIIMSPTAVDEILRFQEEVETGSFKPKTVYNRFKSITDRINE